MLCSVDCRHVDYASICDIPYSPLQRGSCKWQVWGFMFCTNPELCSIRGLLCLFNDRVILFLYTPLCFKNPVGLDVNVVCKLGLSQCLNRWLIFTPQLMTVPLLANQAHWFTSTTWYIPLWDTFKWANNVRFPSASTQQKLTRYCMSSFKWSCSLDFLHQLYHRFLMWLCSRSCRNSPYCCLP